MCMIILFGATAILLVVSARFFSWRFYHDLLVQRPLDRPQPDTVELRKKSFTALLEANTTRFFALGRSFGTHRDLI